MNTEVEPGAPAGPEDKGVLTVSVLDHGYVTLRNLAGPTRRQLMEPTLGDGYLDGEVLRRFDADDTDPADAARMSFNASDKERTLVADLRLCGYLMKNWHTSPFEMVTVWLEMKLPIFVARQFVRHRTVSINEVSGRYVQLPAEWYIPEVVGAAPPPGGAKQGQVNTLHQAKQESFKIALHGVCKESYEAYQIALDDGVAPEHARMFLHLNHYTHWLWKQDMHNMMHFLSLRDHSHAQVEAQAYARAIDILLRKQLPHTMGLYDKYRRQESI